MKSLVLYLFLLILEFFFNFILDIIYKYGKFSKALLKKSLEFFSDEKNGPILFFLYFILLLLKIDFIIKK